MTEKFLVLDDTVLQGALSRALANMPGMRRAVVLKTVVATDRQMHVEVPHDEGDLEESLYFEVSEDGSVGTVGARGCRHAAAVHERLQAPKTGLPIQYTKAGSKSKFIEDPVHQVGIPTMEASAQKRAVKETFGK